MAARKRRRSLFVERCVNIVVSYSAGYVLPQDTDIGTRTLPYDIEDATLSVLKGIYYARGQNPAVILEVTEGVGRTQFAPGGTSNGLTEEVKMQLQPYRSFVW
jgi:hypothetical protein